VDDAPVMSTCRPREETSSSLQSPKEVVPALRVPEGCAVGFANAPDPVLLVRVGLFRQLVFHPINGMIQLTYPSTKTDIISSAIPPYGA
jgi:hypothetical protein